MQALIAIAIGFTLGLLGGGGTILTVPALVYLFQLEPKAAIANSLLVIGCSTLIASINNILRARLPIRSIISFAIFAMIGAFISAKFLAVLISGELQLLLFGGLVLVVALSMLIEQKIFKLDFITSKEAWILGLLIGMVTGLVGVGGGFLVVPVLHYALKLPMKEATSASLIVIALQSLSGFTGYMMTMPIDYKFAISFTAYLLIGIFTASFLAGKLKNETLKRIFAILLLIMGSFILWSRLHFSTLS